MSHPTLYLVLRKAISLSIAVAIIILVIKIIDHFTSSQTVMTSQQNGVKTIQCHPVDYVPPDEPKPGKTYFCPEE